MNTNESWKRAAICAVALAAAVLPLAAASPDVRLSYSLARANTTVAEPVFLNVVAANGSDSPAVANLGINFFGFFRATLARPDGATAKTPRYFDLVGQSGKVPIAGHGSAQRVILLNRWFSFDVPGRYFLEIELTPAASVTDGPVAVFSRGNVVIDVGPRDPTRLANRCATLEEEAIADKTIFAPAGPAEALSYIGDPVAVPYLADLMRRRPILETMLVDGLRRVGDSTAVEVLIPRLNSSSKHSSDLARYALTAIEKKTDDPHIHEMIGAALR